MSWTRKATGIATALGLLLGTAAAAPSVASAQMRNFEEVEPTPKGTIGLGLIGAELGFTIPALAGLDEAWSLTVFPIAGAAGGATAGWFLIDDNDQPEAAVAVLASSIALVIPSMVLTLSATRYDPSEEIAQAKASGSGGAGGSVEAEGSGGGQSSESSPQSRRDPADGRARDIARAGSGVLRWSERGLLLGPPGVALSRDGRNQPYTNPVTSYHVRLFTGVF